RALEEEHFEARVLERRAELAAREPGLLARDPRELDARRLAERHAVVLAQGRDRGEAALVAPFLIDGRDREHDRARGEIGGRHRARAESATGGSAQEEEQREVVPQALRHDLQSGNHGVAGELTASRLAPREIAAYEGSPFFPG